jgi:hypothetical protein
MNRSAAEGGLSFVLIGFLVSLLSPKFRSTHGPNDVGNYPLAVCRIAGATDV